MKRDNRKYKFPLPRLQRSICLAASFCLAAGALAQSAALTEASDPMLSPTDAGYLSRGREMLLQGNSPGTIDQLGRIRTEAIPQNSRAAEEWLYLLATAYYNTGDPRCTRLLERFIAEYPASAKAVEATLTLGDFNFFAHNFDEALAAYRSADISGLGGDDRALYTYREALCMVKCGLYDEARPLFRHIATRSRYATAAKYYDAYIDYVNGDFDKAFGKFGQVADKDDLEAGMEPAYYMCQILFMRGDWRKTIAGGESLIRKHRVKELLPETRRAVGLSYYKLGELRSAEGELEEYVVQAGENAGADAIYALGACRYDRGDLKGASEMFNRLTSDQSAIAQGAYLYLGQIAAAEGKTSAALMNFERAYRMNYDPKVAETALYNYVVARIQGGNIPFDTSIDLLQDFADRYPDSPYCPAVDRSLAEALYTRGDYEKALQAISRVSDTDAETLAVRQRILYGVGTAAVTAGNLRRGESLLRECIGIRGGEKNMRAQTNLWLGDAFYLQGKYESAENAYRRAIEGGLKGSRLDLASYDLGYACLMQDKFRQASSYFKRAADSKSLLPDMVVDARMRVADCKYYSGDYNGALSDFSELEKNSSQADYATLRRAQIMGVRGDVRGKIRLLEQMESKYPHSRWLSDAMTELGDTYEAEGDHRAAAAVYDRMLQLYPEAKSARRTRIASAESYLKLGNELLAKGNRREALETFRKVEQTGVVDFIGEAYVGIMRSTDDAAEQLRYARLVRSVGGLDTDAVDEARLLEAVGSLNSHSASQRREAEEVLVSLAQNPHSLYGARAAVTLAQMYLDTGKPAKAAEFMEDFTSSGSQQQYWVARGFIVLADACEAQGDRNLALEYLQSLRNNYPGRELDIHDMIAKRIKRLQK